MKKILIFGLVMLMHTVCFAYQPLWQQLNKTFSVKGGEGIEQFVNALRLTGDYDWGDEAVFDKKNGYFEFSEEGDGMVQYRGAYWKRKDGKKLFILSYFCTETESPFIEPITSPWGYCSVWKLEGRTDKGLLHDTGFMAYLYDEAGKKLVPMKNPPIEPWNGNEKVHYFLLLPKKGKNIYVRQDDENNDYFTFTLFWNGNTFDNKRVEWPDFYVSDASDTNVRNAPNGKVVTKLESKGIFNLFIDKIENGWCRIYGNQVYEMEEDLPRELTGSTTGYWIHNSVIGAAGMGAGGVTLYAQPDKKSKVVFRSTEHTTIHPVEIKGEWVKVKVEGKNVQGWIHVYDICSNPVTNCC